MDGTGRIERSCKRKEGKAGARGKGEAKRELGVVYGHANRGAESLKSRLGHGMGDVPADFHRKSIILLRRKGRMEWAKRDQQTIGEPRRWESNDNRCRRECRK